MGYNINFDNILNINANAIVNHINNNSKINDYVCNSILNKANSDELNNLIKNNKNTNPGDILITNGYNLKADKIYNVILPNKNDDNPLNSLLTKTYLNLLLKAIDNNIKTIAFFIKQGNINNYSYSQVFDALTSACAEIDMLEEQKNEDLINITICIEKNRTLKSNSKTSATYDFDDEIISLNKNKFNNSYNTFSFVTLNTNSNENNVEKCLDFIKKFNKDEATPIKIKSEFPYDFIDQYLSIHNIDEKVLSKGGLDRQRKYRLRQSKTLKKMDAYRLIFLLKMNNSDVIQFMMCCGLSFNPFDKTDLFFLDYLNGKFKYERIDSLVDLTNLKENVEEALFYYN